MHLGEYDEDHFYDLVEEGLEDAIEHVASLNEWMACKRAIARWITKIDGDMDQAALNREHEVD